jgi:predicted CopG family antitoxin
MQKQLTITIDEQVYQGLHTVVGQGNISQFIEALVRPHVMQSQLASAYQAMAEDEAREADALAWAEGTLGVLDDETW